MLRLIKTNIEAMDLRAAKVMKLGVGFCCILLISALALYIQNDMSPQYSYVLNDLAKTMATTSTVVFAEIIIGSLFMDGYAKTHNIDDKEK